ncbi:MAG: hypothetical protein B7Y40_10375 [Gammaproteobacteria bacterium 28-57-27]|nr:MAG: hypothetical protein B7Y40_10375 [Gammaproteobacteria bacterium 28-57-27]
MSQAIPQTTSRLRILLPLVLLGALAVGGYFYWQQHQPREAPQVLTLYGNIDLRQVNLAFNDSARIVQIAVQAGDRVAAGQVLAQLDTRRFEAALAAAEAALAGDQAVLDKLVAGSRPEDIERLSAIVAADTANYTEKQLAFGREQTLAAQKLSAPQTRDAALAARDAAAGQLKADQASLKLAVIGSRIEDIEQARAAVAAAKAQRDSARIALDDAVLKAPSVGIVRNRILEPGDMASPAQPVLALALTEPIWARVYIDEPDLGRIHEGMAASIRSDSFPGLAFKGWVGYISPTAEFTPKSVESTTVRTDLVYQARIYACNPGDKLRLGMPVSVDIPLHAAPVTQNVGRGETPCGAAQ